MITSSRIVSDDLQADGRRRIVEEYVDSYWATFRREYLGDAGTDAAANLAALTAAWNSLGGQGATDTASVTCEDGAVVQLVRPYGSGLSVNWNLAPTATEKTAVTNIQTFLAKAQPLNDVWDDVPQDKRVELGGHCPRLKGLYQYFKRGGV